jgi:hypothetical protein
MALIKCKECGNQISSDATACPNCGKPVKKTSATASGCLVVIVVVVVLGMIGKCSGSDKAPAPAPSSAAPAAPAAPKAAPNLNDAKALDEAYGTEAFIRCGSEADDYLRQASRFAFKWDEMGFLDQKFDKYRSRVSLPGVLTMISEKASLQNGFGAYHRVELVCEYDTQAKKVLGYTIRER